MKPQIDPRNPVYVYEKMPTDTAFQAACKAAHVEPTRRQYRKWINQRGAAFKKAGV